MHRAIQRFGAGALGLAIVGTTGLAWAWKNGGYGKAHATAGQIVQLTTTGTVFSDRPLIPGNFGDVALNVFNPNRYPVRVNGVALNGGIKVDTGHQEGCSPNSVEWQPTPGRHVWQRLGARETKAFTIPGALYMKADAPDGCAEAEFTIPVLLFGYSAP